MLSSTGILVISAIAVERAPKNATSGGKKKSPKMNVLRKQASPPSRLFLVPKSFLFPADIPTMAAKVSPMDKNAMEQKHIFGLRKATQMTEETII